MEDEDSCKERQENELEALVAIYGDDCEDLRKNDKWKVPRPPEILLHLQPLQSMSGKKDAHVQASVCFKFDIKYPHSIPVISIEKVVGLSDSQQKHILEKVKAEGQVLVGEEMVLELAQIIQEYLHECNKPQVSSVYEEMLINQRKQEEILEKEEMKKRNLQKRREEIQRREIESELERRKEEEKKLRKEAKLHERSAERVNSPDGSHDTRDSSGPTKVCKIDFFGKFPRTIFKGQCLGKTSLSGSTVFAGFDNNSGELVAIHEWSILCPNTSKKANLTDNERAKLNRTLKMISVIQQEIGGLVKLYHENIVPYLGVKNVYFDTYIDVFVMQEFVQGASLLQRLNTKDCCNLEFVQSIAKQLLNALLYLHGRSVVHRNIKASSVFINSNGVAKLSDFGIHKRLSDLHKNTNVENRGVSFSEGHIPSGNNKKSDILMLGMLLLSLSQGKILTNYPPEVPTNLPQNFREFIFRCITEEESKRFTAEVLLQHDFIKAEVSLEVEVSVDEADASGTKESDSVDEVDKIANRTSIGEPSQQLSRLHSEFEELQWLGKGGFGDVVKVRNKLDDRFYAIKRILLDPRRLNFNKKITREVKLLSRLQHENIVRYYNSWIETLESTDTDSSTNTSQSEATTTTTQKSSQINSIGLVDDIENNAPPPIASCSSWGDSASSGFDDEESEEDDSDVFDKIFGYNSDGEESIMFDRESTTTTATTTTSGGSKPTVTSSESKSIDESPMWKRYLYIQMEYCDKSTLRNCIDEGVWKNQSRRWRLFREILDGLSHVHEQGMIHRDLKPQNIFLDSEDHIKIGDFGLATAHAHTRGGISPNTSVADFASSRSEGGDTGVVGTALYVAPEILKSSTRSYSQKVDMYSVGIIFFEMCYGGIGTKMERVKILSNLRTDKISLPEDFDEIQFEREAKIFRMCLTHHSMKRPTALELIKSPFVPSPILQESHVVDAVQQAMRNTSSKSHRLLLHELFNQYDIQKNDVLYDMDMHKFAEIQNVVQAHVFSTVEVILKRHGALRVSIPLLSPRQRFQELNEDNVEADESMSGTFFMDNSGVIISLPNDLRAPFARFISRNNITNIKRYEIAKVYRSRRIFASHPKELWECAFDVVTPTDFNLIPEAECIYVVNEIISTFPVLSQRNYKIFINHTLLLRSILLHAGIPESRHHKMVALFAEAKLKRLSKAQLESRLSELSIPSQQCISLCSMIEQQGPLNKIQATLKPLTKSRQSSVSSQARQALHELEALRKNLDSLGVTLPVIVHLGFVHNYKQFEGIIFQVSAEVQHQRKRVAMEVFAAGGRYDVLVRKSIVPDFHKLQSVYASQSHDVEHTQQRICAAGVSLAIEKIVSLNLPKGKSKKNLWSVMSDVGAPEQSASVDALVVAIGNNALMHERMKILHTLWSAGISAKMSVEGETEDMSLVEMEKHCLQCGIKCLVIVKDRNGGIRVRTVSDEVPHKFTEVVMNTMSEVVEHLSSKKTKDVDNTEKSESSTSSTTGNTKDSSSTNSSSSSKKKVPRIQVELLSVDKKSHTSNVKKKQEALIQSKISQLPILKHINCESHIYVLAVELPTHAIQTLASIFDVSSTEDVFNESVELAKSKLPKHKYIEKIADCIIEAIYQNMYRYAFLIIYSTKSEIHRFIL